jgi:F420H(2)-dependent quinone reductase
MQQGFRAQRDKTPFDKLAQAFARTRLGGWLFVNVFPVGGRHIPVRPREAEGAEREELWRLVNDNYNGYQVYQQRAGQRIIPVVLLEPA